MATVSTLFKVSEENDKKIYDVMSNCSEKTAFMKNALFFYIMNIEKGVAIDRLYPYDELTIGTNAPVHIEEQGMGSQNTPSDEDDINNSNKNNHDDYNDHEDDDYDYENDYEDEDDYEGNLDIPF